MHLVAAGLIGSAQERQGLVPSGNGPKCASAKLSSYNHLNPRSQIIIRAKQRKARYLALLGCHCQIILSASMLAGIAGEVMFQEVMAWLRVEGNLDIAKAAGAAFVTMVGAAVWVWDRIDKRREQQQKREDEEEKEEESKRKAKVPAHLRRQNQKQVPVPQHRLARSAWTQYVAMAVVALGAGGIAASIVSYRTTTGTPSPTSTASPTPQTVGSIKQICRGEKEASCGTHDVFVGCGDVGTWLRAACSSHEVRSVTSRSGGQCGYSTVVAYCVPYVGK